MTIGQLKTALSTLCLALVSGACLIGPEARAWTNDRTAGEGVAPVQPAVDPADILLADSNLEALTSIEVENVYGGSKHEQLNPDKPHFQSPERTGLP